MKRDEYFLDPGHIFFSTAPVTVYTVVGNGVVVCMWDRALRFGGVAHFRYPAVQDPRAATAHYGNVAMASLVHLMEDAGSARGSLVSQILGGARMESASEADDTGARATMVARKILERRGVTIQSEDVGGFMGRKVIFNTGTGELGVIKVHQLRSSDWAS